LYKIFCTIGNLREKISSCLLVYINAVRKFSFTKITQNNGNYLSNIRVICVSTRSCHFQAVLVQTIKNALQFTLYTMVKHPVGQLVETLRYKPEVRGLDSDEVIGIFH